MIDDVVPFLIGLAIFWCLYVFSLYAAYGQASLPINWVNNLEYTGTTTNTINFPASSTGGAWTCGITNYGPYTAGSQSSAQQAINDAESCRTANGSGTTIIFPAGATYSGTSGWTLPQTATDTSTNFIVLTSASPLPIGQTPCSHGIQDNVAASIQPGIRNPGCNGSALSYQLGTTVTSVSGSFTLANGTTTSATAYNDIASMFTVQCTATNCSAIHTAAADTNNVAPHHFAILNAAIGPAAGLAQPESPFKIGVGGESITSEIPNHIHIAYSYLFSDWTDAPVTGGVATGGPTGTNKIPNGIDFLACIYCSAMYNYIGMALDPGAESHAIYLGLAQEIKTNHNWVEGYSIGEFAGGFSTTIAFTNFSSNQDVEDRGNRYTYPYSWMLALDAGFCPNNIASAPCNNNSYVRKNSHESKFAQRDLMDGNIFENVDNSGAQNGTDLSVKVNNCSAGNLCNNYWFTSLNVTITNSILRNACSGPSIGFRSDPTSNAGGGIALATGNYTFANNLTYNISNTTGGCSAPQASSTWGFREDSTVPSTTWAATAVRDNVGLTSTFTLTGASGTMQSDFAIGDPVTAQNCLDTSFNTNPLTMGPGAITGTLLTGLTVVIPNPGTASASTSGCTVSNGQGGPNHTFVSHNTFVLPTTSFEQSTQDPLNSYGGASGISPLARNFTDQNNIHINGNFYSTAGEGTRTETKGYDSTTLIFNNTIITNRAAVATCPGHTGAACYTESGGANNGASPPVTIYLSPLGYCTGNDPTTVNCVGILAAMSTSVFPNVISDWHNYRLCHTGDAACNGKASVYAAGSTHPATDSTDLGAAFPAIDIAETRTLYPCASPCGAGPYPDVPTTTYFAFQTQGGITNTIAALYALPYVNTAVINFAWNQIDTGPTAPSFNWTAYDAANVTAYAPGYTVGTCTTSTGTTTCGVTSSTLVSGQHAFIAGNSGCNGDHLLATASSSSVTFASSCTGTGGTIENSCGSALPQGGQPCKLIVQSQQTFAVGTAKNPVYPFTQVYANSVTPAWTSNTKYGLHSTVKQAGVYYHQTAIGTNGYCISGTVFSTSADGTCKWVSDGSINALPQEVAIGNGFTGDGNGPPSSLWTNAGIVFNANSTNCGTGGNQNCNTIGTLPSAFPLYWETPIQAALANFCTGTDGTNPGMIPHYNATLGTQLLAVMCGAPQSAEWFGALEPFITAQYSMSYTQWSGLYISYAGNNIWSAIDSEYRILGSPSAWGMVVPDGIYAGCGNGSTPACNAYSDLIASTSLVYPENSPGNLGLRISDPINYSLTQPVNGDWVNIFNTYPNTKFHLIEPFSLSCPQWAGSAGCNANQTTTGALNLIFPFSAAHVITGSASSITIPFGDDIVCTYDSGFVVTVFGGGAYPTCINATYTSTITAAGQGTQAYLLTAAVAGPSGSGSVADTGIISCPSSACTAEYFSGTTANLTATPAAGFGFTGWSGGECSGMGTCVVTMNSAQAVTATFAPVSVNYTLVVTVVGGGSVSSSPSGISCPSTCSASYASGTMVTLTAIPSIGYVFAGWSGGGCSGTSTCTVTMNSAQAVTATFVVGVNGGYTIQVGSFGTPGVIFFP